MEPSGYELLKIETKIDGLEKEYNKIVNPKKMIKPN